MAGRSEEICPWRFFDNLSEWSERNPLFPQQTQPAAPAGVSGSW